MLFPGACAWQAAIHHWGLHSSVCSSECPFRSPRHSLHTQPTFSYSCHYYIKWFCSLMFPCRCLSSLQTVNSVKAGQCLSGSPLCPWCLEQSREQESFLKCLSGGGGAIMWSTQKGQGRKKNNKSTENRGRLDGSVIGHLPAAQGVILEFWDRAPCWALPLGACFFLSHSPCLCSLSLAVSLSVKWMGKI